MSALRFDQTGEEILHLRFRRRQQHQRRARPQLHRHAAVLRDVWHGPTAPPLNWVNSPAANLVGPRPVQVFHCPIGLMAS